MAHRKVCSYILKENVDEIPKKSKYFDGSAIFWLIAIALVTVSPAVLLPFEWSYLARATLYNFLAVALFRSLDCLLPGGNWNPSFSWIFFLIFQRTSHPMIVHSLLWSRAQFRHNDKVRQLSRRGITLGFWLTGCSRQMRYRGNTSNSWLVPLAFCLVLLH